MSIKLTVQNQRYDDAGAPAVAADFLPLADGKLDAGAIVDFSNGFILNVDLDEGRY